MWTNEVGKKCLLDCVEVLDWVGIPFFLMQGTALGAYRDHGFVPTEGDIDFGVLYENLEPKVEELIIALDRQKFQIETWSLPFTKTRTVVAWKYGVHVDIVGWMKWGNKRFTHTPVHPSVPQPYCLVHEADLMETYEIVTMFSMKFEIPSPIQTYLEREYGEDWRTPKHDHVSRTRIYDFIEREQIPNDLLS